MYVPNPKLEMPSLLYPKRKPVGRVKIDWSHPIAEYAQNILLFNDQVIPPRNSVDNNKWTAYTTYGSQHYAYQPKNGNMTFARQDLDESGISYYGTSIGVDDTSLPYYMIMIYTVLVAPSGSNKGIAQRDISSSPRSGNPLWTINSASSTMLKLYTANQNMFSNIPVQVGFKHILVLQHDGLGNYNFYDSAKGVWEAGAGAENHGNASNVDWIGTGYAAEIPTAFELFISGYGKAPALQELKEFVKNPYQFLNPA